MAQLRWVRDHLADIESDMSAFHRVDDIGAMNSARFFRLAWRLTAYRGVMRERATAEQQDEPRPAEASRPSGHQQEQPRPATRVVIGADPSLAGIFSFGTSTKS